MKTTPHTVSDWQDTITRLEADLEDLTQRDATCRQERKALSLAIATGDQDARTKGEQLELEGVRLTLELQTLHEALQQARAGLQTAAEAQRDEERKNRAEALAEALEARHEAAKRVDAALEGMADALLSWLDAGDAITNRGGDGHAKQSRGQLGAAIWHHLSESGLNRAEPWKYRTIADCFSGDSRPSPARWRPLADNP